MNEKLEFLLSEGYGLGKMNHFGFEKWLEHFKDDKKVKSIAKKIHDLTKEYFEEERITCLGEMNLISADLDSRMHLEIHDKLYAKLRYELYIKC